MADIQKRIAALAGKDLRNHTFNRRVLADVRCGFVGGNDGYGPGWRDLRGKRTAYDEQGETA